MNRNLTYLIRFFLDEFIPAFIRDSKWFMFPLYCIAYRFHNIKTIMNFKKYVYRYSQADFKAFYSNLNSISRHRLTDLNKESLEIILNVIATEAGSYGRYIGIIDVGCGSGYTLKKIQDMVEKESNLKYLIGSDIVKNKHFPKVFPFVESDVLSLPFFDNSFDIVLCCHMLEHIIDVKKAIVELYRVARQKIIIVVPCQRYYFYTLDEHVHFFQYVDQMLFTLGISSSSIVFCKKIKGDWLLVLDAFCSY